MQINFRLQQLAGRSSYSHHFTSRGGKIFLIIRDLDSGLSVTNNIEAIIEYIFSEPNKYSSTPEETVIIYEDSEGIYDAFDWRTQMFISLGEVSEEDAISRFITNRIENAMQDPYMGEKQ